MNEKEDDWEDSETDCEYCGKIDTPENPLYFMLDPWGSGMNDDYSYHWICEDCCSQRSMDL